MPLHAFLTNNLTGLKYAKENHQPSLSKEQHVSVSLHLKLHVPMCLCMRKRVDNAFLRVGLAAL